MVSRLNTFTTIFLAPFFAEMFAEGRHGSDVTSLDANKRPDLNLSN